MVVAVVADLNVLEAELGEDLLPGLAIDEGGGVHSAAVRDNQNVLHTATTTLIVVLNIGGGGVWTDKRTAGIKKVLCIEALQEVQRCH